MGRMIRSYTTYEAAQAIPGVAGNTPICELNPPQANSSLLITMGLVRLTVVLQSALQGTFGLVAAFTAGTPTVPGTKVGFPVSRGNGGYDETVTGPGRLISAWTVAPTLAGAPNYLQLALLPGLVGDTFEWTWPTDDPFTFNLGRSPTAFQPGMILQNLNGGASPDVLVSARWMEFNPDA